MTTLPALTTSTITESHQPPGEGDALDEGVTAATKQPASSGSPWPVVVALVALAAAAAVAGRPAWSRRTVHRAD